MGLDVAKEYSRIMKTRQEIQKLLESSKLQMERSWELPSNITDLSMIKIACIMDEFTFLSFDPECKLLQLSLMNWREEIESFEPNLLFVESAWKGKDDLWDRKISNPSDDIVNLVQYCNVRRIPTVFWNKEDPVHFNTFISTAKLFDFVFSTDIDSIRRYKSMGKDGAVFLLPFAAQPKMHNPIEKYERKEAFFFAGSYYKRYPERQRDFKTTYETLSQLGKFDIYDRYQGAGIENYSFPDEYSPAIVGQLPTNEIDKAYKGYYFGINMNSIKQSQSMFARRVFELMASNTSVVGNYSRGLRAFFGDLTISTDDSGELMERTKKLISDKMMRDKIRLASLRSVLSQHTYADRLRYVVDAVFENKISDKYVSVTLIASVRSKAEAECVIRSYNRQRYHHKNLVLFTETGKDLELPEGSTSISIEGEGKNISDIEIQGSHVAFLCPDDYYGANYVGDLVNALKYSEIDVVGKLARYHKSNDGVELVGEGEYKVGNELPLRACVIPRGKLGEIGFHPLSEITNGTYRGACFGIDRFNYCMNNKDDACTIVDDLSSIDTGLDLSRIDSVAERITKGSSSGIVRELNGNDLLSIFPASKTRLVNAQSNLDGTITLTSGHEDTGHEYLYLKKRFKVSELDPADRVKFYLDSDPGLNLSLVLFILDGMGEKLTSMIVRQGRIAEMDVPQGGTYLHFAIRPEGHGSTTVRGIVFGDIDHERGCYIGKGSVLAIVNHYPEYSDLYRNAFIHSRFAAYKKEGLIVDVVKISPSFKNEFYEFNNIDVTSLQNVSDLHIVLDHGGYKVVLVHFLIKKTWDVLKQYIDNINVTIWIHGFEVQPYHRRDFNYKNDEERNRAIKASEERSAFWKDLFEMRNRRLHFVFVSQYFANEVMEDIGVELYDWQYSVIHNFVDTDSFEYIPKQPEDRLKILSIRSFASRKYANDLTVNAIQELSNKSYFGKLDIMIVGDGALFDETVEPLKKFPNVHLEKRFLSVAEYKLIFRDHGILLTPTRWDSQGVTRDEAMSSGMVIISNRISGVPEFVDEKTGILVDPEDFKGIADAVDRLYNDPHLFLKLSEAAGKRVRAQNGFENTIKRELDLIDRGPDKGGN